MKQGKTNVLYVYIKWSLCVSYMWARYIINRKKSIFIYLAINMHAGFVEVLFFFYKNTRCNAAAQYHKCVFSGVINHTGYFTYICMWYISQVKSIFLLFRT